MIERNMNEVLVKEQPSVQSLIEMLGSIDRKKDLGNVSIYHQFPLYPDETGRKIVTPSLLLVSQSHGVVIFECAEFSDRAEINLEQIVQDLNEIDRIIFAKILKDAPGLQRARRELKVTITPVIYYLSADGQTKLVENSQDIDFISNQSGLESLLEKYNGEPLSDADFKDLKATIEGSKGIPKVSERKLKDKVDYKNSKGAILTLIESAMYNFDIEQKRAALFTIDGAQRIRGLAGSGKTIILAMKAAQIHLQNPDAEILYTYYTKSLNDLVKRLVTRFYRQFAEKDPNWNKIHIMHAWGGKSLEGVYYNACKNNGVYPMSLDSARFKSTEEPFDFICQELNKNVLKTQYDYCLLDEAQDFPISFYRLCRALTRNNRVVWAYDDFQNILDIKLQSEKETFGRDLNGEWYIDFERSIDHLQDLVLHKCYRNPRKILIAAFSLGIGIYNTDAKSEKAKVLQRLESNDHWESLGFKVESGDSSPGSKMVISRPLANSFELKNTFLDDPNEIIKVLHFEGMAQECASVADLILEDLSKELNPEDISVVCMDNRNAKTYFGFIEQKLSANGVKCFNLLNVPTNNSVFKVKDHVTLSSIFRAKGNEAGSVYIIGID